MSGNFDLGRELLEGMSEVLTKTDCHPRYCDEASNRASYFYNQLSSQLVGNYENRAYAQPVKDWRLKTAKCAIGELEELSQGGMENVVWGDLPTAGEVYNWTHLALKDPRGRDPEVPPLSPVGSPASARD